MRWVTVLLLILLLAAALTFSGHRAAIPAGRSEVLFWHFWGGKERVVVDEVVRRFNESQNVHYVRAVAMPGNNLDLKLFLAITGEDPPDLVNQDDPIIGDWAQRGAILSLREFVTTEQLSRLKSWLFPAAWQLAAYQQKAYGLCNGLDVRALIYNKSLLRDYDLEPPKTIAELDQLADRITPAGTRNPKRMGFLPKPRNLWAWGVVFGGDFYDETGGQITLADQNIVRALEWMASYGRRYGDVAVSFRARDQSLPGQTFPLIAGRYAAIVDGQRRVNDIKAAQAAQRAARTAVTEYGVVALPAPDDGGLCASRLDQRELLRCAAGCIEFRRRMGVHEVLERLWRPCSRRGRNSQGRRLDSCVTRGCQSSSVC